MAKGGILAQVRRLLGGGADIPAPTRRGSRAGELRSATADADFESRLKALLDRPDASALLSGRINFIGLAKAKERLGATWDRMAERAERIARHTIDRHLDLGDIYNTTNGFDFIIVFARLTREQAQMKCLLIADEIAKALFGEDGDDLLEVKTAVAQVDGKLDFKSINLTEQVTAALASVDDLEFAPEAAPAAPVAARAGGDVLGDLRFAYRPGWDQARDVLSTYRCVARVPTSDIGSALIDAELVAGNDIDALSRLDNAVQQRVLSDIDEAMKEQRRMLLIMPVHFEVLGVTTWRRRFVAELAQRVAAEARKLLVIELTGIPHGVLQSRLMELVGALRAHCRGVALRLPIGITDVSQVKGCGAAIMGCDLYSHPAPEVVQMQQMNHFKRAADKAELPAFVHGAHTLSLVAAAVGAGFSYVSGEAVSPLVDHPRQIAEFNLANLYRC